MRARQTFLEANLARCLVFDDDNGCGVESLVAEWDQESSFGIAMGESGGGIGESGNSVRCAGVFFGCCGGGIIWASCCFLLRNYFWWRVLIFELFFLLSLCNRISAVTSSL